MADQESDSEKEYVYAQNDDLFFQEDSDQFEGIQNDGDNTAKGHTAASLKDEARDNPSQSTDGPTDHLGQYNGNIIPNEDEFRSGYAYALSLAQRRVSARGNNQLYPASGINRNIFLNADPYHNIARLSGTGFPNLISNHPANLGVNIAAAGGSPSMVSSMGGTRTSFASIISGCDSFLGSDSFDPSLLFAQSPFSPSPTAYSPPLNAGGLPVSQPAAWSAGDSLPGGGSSEANPSTRLPGLHGNAEEVVMPALVLCRYCHMTVADLESHIKQHHTKSNPVPPCPKLSCGKVSKDWKSHRRHINTEGCRPWGVPKEEFPCPREGCECSFSRSDNLTRHLKAAH